MTAAEVGFNFTGKTLLVTGAAGSIGMAIARLFHQSGCRVALADNDRERVEALARDLDASGRTAVTLHYDAGAPDEGAKAVEHALAAYGQLDYLIPSAGIYPEHPLLEISDAEWSRTMRINLDGVFQVCRAAAPKMKSGGAIVNLASIAGHRGSLNHGHYAASKGAILALTRSMAREWAPALRVNAVSPGVIASPMTQSLVMTAGEKLLNETPMRRFGEPEEVATVAAFLCSDGASFINGEAIQINGGLLMD